MTARGYCRSKKMRILQSGHPFGCLQDDSGRTTSTAGKSRKMQILHFVQDVN
jgi:hypothetical protein